MATSQQIHQVYDGSASVTLRVLRALGWGPELLCLGYFVARGPLNALNLLPSRFRLAAAQDRLLRRAAALLAPQRGDRILDVACGRGRSSYHLAQAHPGTDVTGVDLLPANVAVASTLYANTRGLAYEVGDAQRLRFAPGSFDKVFCLEAAFHFPDRGRFLAEAARVLRPGGRLVVVDFVWTSPERQTGESDPRFGLVQRTWGFESFATEAEYTDAASQLGLAVVGHYDWTGRVTKPLQGQFDVLARLGLSQRGRWLLGRSHERLRGFSRGEWQELARAAEAHAFVHARTRYVALVLEKKP